MCLLKWCYIPGQVSTNSASPGDVNLRLFAVPAATKAKLFVFISYGSAVLKASPRQSHRTNRLQVTNCI
jgi:hypothetical protein